MKKFSKIGYYILVSGIVIIGGLLIISMLPIPGNFQIKIVLSGSMEPSIKTGSIVVVKSSGKYEIGDIIMYGEDTKDKVPTTHRIVEMRIVEGEYRFITKGDANDSIDSGEREGSDITGKILFSVPYVGFILDMVKKPLGFAFLIGVPAAAIIGDELWKIWKEVRRMRKKNNNLPSHKASDGQSNNDNHDDTVDYNDNDNRR